MSTLRADKIVSSDGSNRVLLNNTGNVIQAVQSVLTTASSTTSSTYVDSGLSATITPGSTGNKILVIADFSSGGNDSFNRQEWTLTRGDTEIYIGDAGPSSEGRSTGKFINGQTTVSFRARAIYLDSPATTSATTYKIRMRDGNGDGTVYFNQSKATNASNGTMCCSTMTLMEVVG